MVGIFSYLSEDIDGFLFCFFPSPSIVFVFSELLFNWVFILVLVFQDNDCPDVCSLRCFSMFVCNWEIGSSENVDGIDKALWFAWDS